eukprot:s76_g32.t1
MVACTGTAARKGRKAIASPLVLGRRPLRAQLPWWAYFLVSAFVILLVERTGIFFVAENAELRQRMTSYEAAASASAANGAGGVEVREVLQALKGLPDALAKMAKPKGLFDSKGLGKPQTLGEDAENRFRLWAVKLEDYVYGVFGGKSREVLEWAASMDVEIGDKEISDNFGANSDLLDQWDEVYEFNNQLYSVLRATTEGVPFDVVENVMTGAGLDAWRSLHKRFDPATGSRKRVMLHALTNPERATYETLQSALERWKTLKLRYDKKKDQFGAREPLPESLAMNSLEKLVPKDLEQHLLLNHTRFKTFEEMEVEVVSYIEVKTGNRLNISTNFAKSSGSSGVVPMDVDSLVRAVQGSISSLAQTKGGGKKGSGGSNKISQKFDGNCDLCGKYGHRRKDCWSKSSSGGKGGGTASRSGSSSPKKEIKFAGKCNHCGKPGHKKADCWSLNGKGKSGGKGKDQKAKAASSLESHPEPEPASASGLELCSLELATLTLVQPGERGRERPSSPTTLPSRTRRSQTSSPPTRTIERPFNADASRSRTTSRRSRRPRRSRTPRASSRSRSVRWDDSRNEFVYVTPEETPNEDEEWVEEEVQQEELPEEEPELAEGNAEPDAGTTRDRSPSVVSSLAPGEPHWICCNLDTGASVTVFPKRLFDNLEPTSMRLRTASGEVVQGYGRAAIRGEDTTGMKRKLNGNVADVHKVLISAGQMHEKGFTSWLGQGGGEIIPKSHPVNKALEDAYYKAVAKYGKEGIIPVLEEDGIYNFYLKEDLPEEGAISPKSPAEPPSQGSSGGGPVMTHEVRQVPTRTTTSDAASSARLACAIGEAVDLVDDQGEGFSEGVEARPARPGWDPAVPTEEEKREHESSGHAVFRNWCPECLAATGYAKQHRKVDHSQETMHTVVMDFFYLGEEEGSKPHLVAQDRSTGMMMATALEKKGNPDTTAQKLLTRFLELLGWKEVVLKSDGEHPLVKLKKAAGKDAQTVTKVVCEESPSGDSRANGEAEAAVREVKWRIRAVTMTLEKKLGCAVAEGYPLLTWVPRYAAEQANRHRVGADGKTPEERRTGKRWIKALPVFGERIMVKPAGKGRRGDMSRMVEGRFVGCHNRFGSILAMTKDGVVVGSSYHTLSEDQKWGELEPDLKGAPWDVRKYVKKKPQEDQQQLALPAPAPMIGAAPLPGPALPPEGQVRDDRVPGQGEAEGSEEAVDKSPMIGEPSASAQVPSGLKRAWPVRREHLAKYGKTTGCPGCQSLIRGTGFQQMAHSEECRQRIKRHLDEAESKSREELKRLREEDQSMDPHETPAAAAEPGNLWAGGEPAGSRAAGGEPAADLGDSLPAEAGVKRKAEDEIQDVDDLVRSMESGETIQERSIQALSEVLDSYEAAKTVAQLAAMDVIELFSPTRVNQYVERFGLRKGAAIDLEELKPDGSDYWDLDRQEDFEQVMDLITMEQPWLLTSSPPCTTFSPLRRLSNFKRPKEIVEAEEALGRLRLSRSMECCKLQDSLGGYYLHEHPKEASSWDEEDVDEMVNLPNTFLVQSPMCRFNMMTKHDDGQWGHVRKETLWMTNSEEIARELQGVCNNYVPGQEPHRHVHLVGASRAKAAQVYPKDLCEAILRGLKNQLEKDHSISSMEEMVGGPAPDDTVEWDHQMNEFVDDSSGQLLDAELVKRARQEELDWLRKENVYVRVKAEECTGKPLQLKWVDVNKGDHQSPKIRSRLVAKEIKRAKPLAEQLGGADTFAATPPIESVFALMSSFMTRRSRDEQRKFMAAWDVSRAHFMGKAARDIFVELPDEDKVHPEDEGPMMGKLLRSMYGTQDASQIFQKDYQDWLKSKGASFCALCPAIFKMDGLTGLVHGDDFLVVGSMDKLKEFDKILNDKYTARWESLLGKDNGEKQEMFFLNRLVKYYPDGAGGGERLEIEADARHVDLLVKDFGFDEKTKGCDVPEDKPTTLDFVETERQPGLGGQMPSQFRSMVMRLAYLAQDRPDLCHAVRALAGAMKSPKMNDWLRLKKVVRYLLKFPYMKRVFYKQTLENAGVTAYSDSDWAGDLRTRRSTSGSVIKWGSHTLLVKGSSQKVVALSSSESEYYAMARTATLSEFVRGIFEFWEWRARTTKLRVDSSSAKALSERRGVGQSRHIQAKYLWVQDRVAEKQLEVEKVKGPENDADLVTKVQTRAVIQGHLGRLGFQASCLVRRRFSDVPAVQEAVTTGDDLEPPWLALRVESRGVAATEHVKAVKAKASQLKADEASLFEKPQKLLVASVEEVLIQALALAYAGPSASGAAAKWPKMAEHLLSLELTAEQEELGHGQSWWLKDL